MNKKRIVIICTGITVVVFAALVALYTKIADGTSHDSHSDGYVEEKKNQEDSHSVKIRNEKDLVYDVEYKDSRKMDIAYRKDGTKKPLLICVHGGYYSSGSKSEMKKYADEFSADGYVVASIDYPLLPNGTIVTQVESVIKAVDYLVTNADIYEIDKGRVSLLGFSSGAHLAVNAAEKIVKRKSNLFTLAAVIDISGPTDYRYLIEEYEGEEHVSPAIIDGNDEADLSDELTKVDCTDNITSNLPKTLIIHGKEDETVPYEVSVRFNDSLAAAGVDTELKIIDSMGHATDMKTVVPMLKAFLER